MRKILWIIPLFLAAIGTPSAHADEYVNGSFDDGAFTIVPNGTIQVSTALGQGITAADITLIAALE
jgi:hypothetical protein